MANLDLTDTVYMERFTSAGLSVFTWRQRKLEVHCRLDFFLISLPRNSNFCYKC